MKKQDQNQTNTNIFLKFIEKINKLYAIFEKELLNDTYFFKSNQFISNIKYEILSFQEILNQEYSSYFYAYLSWIHSHFQFSFGMETSDIITSNLMMNIKYNQNIPIFSHIQKILNSLYQYGIEVKKNYFAFHEYFISSHNYFKVHNEKKFDELNVAVKRSIGFIVRNVVKFNILNEIIMVNYVEDEYMYKVLSYFFKYISTIDVIHDSQINKSILDESVHFLNECMIYSFLYKTIYDKDKDSKKDKDNHRNERNESIVIVTFIKALDFQQSLLSLLKDIQNNISNNKISDRIRSMISIKTEGYSVFSFFSSMWIKNMNDVLLYEKQKEDLFRLCLKGYSKIISNEETVLIHEVSISHDEVLEKYILKSFYDTLNSKINTQMQVNINSISNLIREDMISQVEVYYLKSLVSSKRFGFKNTDNPLYFKGFLIEILLPSLYFYFFYIKFISNSQQQIVFTNEILRMVSYLFNHGRLFCSFGIIINIFIIKRLPTIYKFLFFDSNYVSLLQEYFLNIIIISELTYISILHFIEENISVVSNEDWFKNKENPSVFMFDYLGSSASSEQNQLMHGVYYLIKDSYSNFYMKNFKTYDLQDYLEFISVRLPYKMKHEQGLYIKFIYKTIINNTDLKNKELIRLKVLSICQTYQKIIKQRIVEEYFPYSIFIYEVVEDFFLLLQKLEIVEEVIEEKEFYGLQFLYDNHCDIRKELLNEYNSYINNKIKYNSLLSIQFFKKIIYIERGVFSIESQGLSIENLIDKNNKFHFLIAEYFKHKSNDNLYINENESDDISIIIYDCICDSLLKECVSLYDDGYSNENILLLILLYFYHYPKKEFTYKNKSFNKNSLIQKYIIFRLSNMNHYTILASMKFLFLISFYENHLLEKVLSFKKSITKDKKRGSNTSNIVNKEGYTRSILDTKAYIKGLSSLLPKEKILNEKDVSEKKEKFNFLNFFLDITQIDKLYSLVKAMITNGLFSFLIKYIDDLILSTLNKYGLDSVESLFSFGFISNSTEYEKKKLSKYLFNIINFYKVSVLSSNNGQKYESCIDFPLNHTSDYNSSFKNYNLEFVFYSFEFQFLIEGDVNAYSNFKSYSYLVDLFELVTGIQEEENMKMTIKSLQIRLINKTNKSNFEEESIDDLKVKYNKLLHDNGRRIQNIQSRLLYNIIKKNPNRLEDISEAKFNLLRLYLLSYSRLIIHINRIYQSIEDMDNIYNSLLSNVKNEYSDLISLSYMRMIYIQKGESLKVFNLSYKIFRIYLYLNYRKSSHSKLADIVYKDYVKCFNLKNVTAFSYEDYLFSRKRLLKILLEYSKSDWDLYKYEKKMDVHIYKRLFDIDWEMNNKKILQYYIEKGIIREVDVDENVYNFYLYIIKFYLNQEYNEKNGQFINDMNKKVDVSLIVSPIKPKEINVNQKNTEFTEENYMNLKDLFFIYKKIFNLNSKESSDKGNFNYYKHLNEFFLLLKGFLYYIITYNSWSSSNFEHDFIEIVACFFIILQQLFDDVHLFTIDKSLINKLKLNILDTFNNIILYINSIHKGSNKERVFINSIEIFIHFSNYLLSHILQKSSVFISTKDNILSQILDLLPSMINQMDEDRAVYLCHKLSTISIFKSQQLWEMIKSTVKESLIVRLKLLNELNNYLALLVNKDEKVRLLNLKEANKILSKHSFLIPIYGNLYKVEEKIYYSSILQNIKEYESITRPIQIKVIGRSTVKADISFSFIIKKDESYLNELNAFHYFKSHKFIMNNPQFENQNDYLFSLYNINYLGNSTIIVETIEGKSLKKTVEKLWTECGFYIENPYNEKKVEENITKSLKGGRILYKMYDKFRIVKDWDLAKRLYSSSCSTWSVIGYISGLGDRHIENILISEKNCELKHIDYGHIFGSGQNLKIKEIVSYRLSPNIVNALGILETKGQFLYSMLKLIYVFESSFGTLCYATICYSSDDKEDKRNKNEKMNLTEYEFAQEKINNFFKEDKKNIIQLENNKSKSIDNLGLMFYGWMPFI